MLLEFALLHQLLAVGEEHGGLSVTDLASGATLWKIAKAHRGGITQLAFSADGQLLASAGQDRIVQIWQARTGVLWCSFPIAFPVTGLRWSSTSSLACAGKQQIVTWTIQEIEAA